MDCSPPGSPVHGIFQAKILEQVAISYPKGSSQPRARTCFSYIGRWILYYWATWEAPERAIVRLQFWIYFFSMRNLQVDLGKLYSLFFTMFKFHLWQSHCWPTVWRTCVFSGWVFIVFLVSLIPCASLLEPVVFVRKVRCIAWGCGAEKAGIELA